VIKVTFDELFNKLKSVVDGSGACYGFFRMRMVGEIELCPELPNNWQEVELDDEEEVVEFFDLAVNTLEKIGIRLDCDPGDEICQKLFIIESSFKRILEEEFDIKLRPAESMTPKELLRKTGVEPCPEDETYREIGYLRLEKQGREIAEKLEPLIEKSYTRQTG